MDKHWNIIQYSRDCGQLFQKPIIGFRRLPNLKDKLTNAKCTLQTDKPVKQTNSKIELCKKFLTCKFCKMIDKTKDYTWNYNYTQKFKCNIPHKSRITCKIQNVIYCIICKKCKKQYVGETMRPFQRRMYEHILSVEKPQPYRDTPVSRHFLKNGHSKKDMQFHIIEHCRDRQSKWRKERENYWIWRKKTIQNFGINQIL